MEWYYAQDNERLGPVNEQEFSGLVQQGIITYLHALGRYFAEIVSAMPLNIGYIMAAFDDEKRSLHDHLCTTRVIKTR